MLDDKNDEFIIFDDDDEMIFELTADDKTLDELLAERELTFEQAFSLAKKYIAEYNDLLGELNLSGLSRGRIWAEFIRSCKMEMTDRKRRLLCILMTGGWLLEEDHDKGDEDYEAALVRAWLKSSNDEESLAFIFQKRRDKRAEFQAILAKLSKAGKPQKLPQINSDRYCAIFNLLCEDEYRHEKVDLVQLKQNVANIQAVISMYPELEKIAPLVYFRIYCKNNNKLYIKKDDYSYIPTVKNLFNYQEYSFVDNGKNFKQYTKYFKLYYDLMNIFPDADFWLCQQGFLACSNLAEWGVEHIDLSENFPPTDRIVVDAYSPSIFDNSSLENPFWHDENVTVYQLWEWQEKHNTLDSAAANTVQSITFDELETFLADTNRFCEKLLQESVLNDRVNTKTYNIAHALLMARIEGRFDELLAGEIAGLVSK